MRVASVFFVAILLGMAIAGAIGRIDSREAGLIAKAQDRAPIDRSMEGLARAQLSTE
jgi:hypothetical protein